MVLCLFSMNYNCDSDDFSCFFIEANGYIIDKAQDTAELVLWSYGSMDEICKH